MCAGSREHCVGTKSIGTQFIHDAKYAEQGIARTTLRTAVLDPSFRLNSYEQ